MQRKALKFRMYPNEEQEVQFVKTFGCCRFVFNYCLEKHRKLYETEGKTMSYYDYTAILTNLRKEFEFLCEVDAKALRHSLSNLAKAFRRYFKGNSGYPKFKTAKKSRKSFTTEGCIRIEGDCVRLPKVGLVKIKQTRPIPEDWQLKTITVIMEADGCYYCSLMFEYEPNIQPVQIENAIGLDYKTSCLYVDSNGMTAEMPKFYKEASKQLAKKQHKLSRMKFGSNNYNKAKKQLAKAYAHVANQRKDFLHKKSTEIANQYDLVCIENISIKEQMRNRRFKSFRKSTLDNGWYAFTVMLEYKLKDRGKQLVKVGKDFPSSQMCSCCGNINNEVSSDSVRVWDCPSCGAHLDRDVNAATNILHEGLRIIS